MPFANAINFTQLDPKEDDAIQCVDHMRPQIQAMIDERFKGEAVLWALNVGFADFLRQRGGGDFQIKKAVAAYTELDRESRDDAQICYGRVRDMLSSLRKEGFSLDAIAWSLIGGLSNILSVSRITKAEKEDYVAGLILALNAARSASMN